MTLKRKRKFKTSVRWWVSEHHQSPKNLWEIFMGPWAIYGKQTS